MSDRAALEARQRKHVLFTWTAQQKAVPLHVSGGRGAIFTDAAGQDWLDFESQVFNCNAGHGEQRIIDAITRQAEELACAHPAAVFESKARLGELLAEVTPGDLNHFFLCLSGAEAVENAFKMARLVTGRKKVIARRRSYHGASMGALSLTGDWRRLPLEPGVWGVVRAEDPYCYRCPYEQKYPQCGVRCAANLESLIQMEGPDQIAAIFLEGITGANGGFVPPDEYWPMVREICTRYGILLVSDEVFTGFGRTGEWFAVDHWGVVPDLITMAKGLTSGYAPLGAVAMSDAIAAHFQDETLWCGLTSYAHPIACAAAQASIEVYQSDGLIDRARALEPRMMAGLNKLKSRHAQIGDVRGRGLFGTIELVKEPGSKEPLVPYRGPAHAGLIKALRARHLHILHRGSCVFICPPLCITEAELDDGIDRIDNALEEVFSS